MKKPEPFTKEQIVLIQQLLKNIIASGINAAQEAREDSISDNIRLIKYEIIEQLKDWDEEHPDED